MKPRSISGPTPEERLAILGTPRFAPLEAWRARLAEGGRRVPHVDPLDGGVDARLLLLLETPGPGDAPIRFVSRDNPSGTGRNLGRFLAEARIARQDMLLWNAAPWIAHAPGAKNRALTRPEIREGIGTLPALLALLPRLEIVVLAGRVAAQARQTIAETRASAAIIEIPHPSPANVCTSADVASRIREGLAQAAAMLHA
jgi:uracil-DNA glycosylase